MRALLNEQLLFWIYQRIVKLKLRVRTKRRLSDWTALKGASSLVQGNRVECLFRDRLELSRSSIGLQHESR